MWCSEDVSLVEGIAMHATALTYCRKKPVLLVGGIRVVWQDRRRRPRGGTRVGHAAAKTGQSQSPERKNNPGDVSQPRGSPHESRHRVHDGGQRADEPNEPLAARAHGTDLSDRRYPTRHRPSLRVCPTVAASTPSLPEPRKERPQPRGPLPSAGRRAWSPPQRTRATSVLAW